MSNYKKQDGFIELSAAIVKQAISDYKDKKNRAEIEEFIKGEWFGRLTTLDPDYLLEYLHRKYKVED